MAVFLAILKNLCVNSALNGCVLTILDVFLPVSGSKKRPVLDVFMAVILCMTVLLAEVYTV